MPIKTGVQAVQAIRTFYENLRCDYSEAADLQDPEYIILTAFKTPHFEAYLIIAHQFTDFIYLVRRFKKNYLIALIFYLNFYSP